MKRAKADNTGRKGVYAVGKATEELSWIFREQPTSDHGIDAHVEIVTKDDEVTGRMFALQIKSGVSFFKETAKDGIIFRGDTAHLEYWQRHSLPVIVALHHPDDDRILWQVVTDENVEETEKGWKMTVPASNLYDDSARDKLQQICDVPDEQKRLGQLAVAKPWMDLLLSGKRLFLEAEEWVNKSSGRGSLSLLTEGDDGQETLVEEWPFVMFPGQLYPELLPTLFPWADLEIDAEHYEPYDEQEYDNDCGIWDSEDGCYIGHTQTFEEWADGFSDIRPYTIESGEVAAYRLELTLNDIGKAYLALENYLTKGTVKVATGRIGHDYEFGLKALARKYGLDEKQ